MARLFSDVTETCQTWLDEKIFRGMFGPSINQNKDQNRDQNLDQEHDGECGAWCGQEGAAVSPLDESWSALSCSSGAEVDISFRYGECYRDVV